ncbi:hypothetical protein F5141DRAFT_1061637 [Pisolithus sp. B1]|nr:hypothetical protein F5141DRAFT_1061637 [Pisolithus sp. B1]
MTAAGLTSKATWAELVWNLHQAWYAHANPKASGEHMKDYYSCQAKNYEDHKDEEEYPQLWVEICANMVQCRGHPYISKLLDYLATIMKYKVLNSAASVPLPNFTTLSQVSYDWALALKPQESRHDHNHHVLPVVFMHKLYEVNLVSGQKNVPWKTLLDVLYTTQYMIMDWPAHVPAVGPDFNIRHLNANELCALVVPFLKEKMGVDYHAEAPGEEEDQDGAMIVPSSLFHLKKWTPVIPLLLAPSIIHANIIGTINLERNHHREGSIIVLFDMSIETFHISDAMAMIQMMTIIDMTTTQATEGSVPQ